MKEEITIDVSDTEGKLTNVIASAFYEENLPYVQREIIDILFK